MTLAEFILARVAEDETVARFTLEMQHSQAVKTTWQWLRTSTWRSENESTTTWPGAPDPARVLRQCEAIRRIVPIADAQSKWDAMGSATDEDGWAILEALASIWADHPDYPA